MTADKTSYLEHVLSKTDPRHTKPPSSVLAASLALQ